MISGDLQLVEEWAEPLIRRLQPVQRRRLLMHLARGLRRRQAERIKAQQDPEGKAYAPRKPRRGRKDGPMFARLRQTKHLKAVADPFGAAVGFAGRSARIARIHSEGGEERLATGGPLVRYPERPLLGYTDDDHDWVMSEVDAYLSAL